MIFHFATTKAYYKSIFLDSNLHCRQKNFGGGLWDESVTTVKFHWEYKLHPDESSMASNKQNRNRTMDGCSTLKQADPILMKNEEDLDLIAHVR